jgi:hypothetical protein
MLLAPPTADELTQAEATWITERELRKAQAGSPDGRTGRLRGGLGRRPDGVLVLESGEWVAIEVELHRKRRLVYERILTWYLSQTATYAAVRWYVRGAGLARLLESVIADYRLDDLVSVWDALARARKQRVGRYG